MNERDGDDEGQKRLEAQALATQEAADEILAIVIAQLERGSRSALDWSGGRLVALLLATAWRASQATLNPMTPADYVAFVRGHADTVETIHCGG